MATLPRAPHSAAPAHAKDDKQNAPKQVPSEPSSDAPKAPAAGGSAPKQPADAVVSDDSHEGHEHQGHEHQGHEPSDDERKAKEHEADKGKSAAPKDEQPKYPVLEADKAYTLFYNGHKIAKDGDPPDKWISMGRLGDSTAVVQSPLTQEMTEAIKTGQWYLADQEALNVPQAPTTGPESPPATEAPTVRDKPYASGPSGNATALVGETVNVTMGNWENEPNRYAYLWKRRDDDGQVVPLESATESTYVTTSNDEGNSLFCAVEASNDIGQGHTESNDVPITAPETQAAKAKR